ncbi:response regulator [Devosia ginsengisoli]|nr:response regulator transcription factor [Devosia ginsengisoli]
MAPKCALETLKSPYMTIALVDDHPIFLEGLKELLSSEAPFQIVGEADSAAAFVELIAATTPDLAIVDLSMPGDVFDAINRLASSTKIVVYTAYCSTETAVRALEAGAVGFVLKTSPYEELLEAIDAVCSGQFFVTKQYASSVTAALREQSQSDALFTPTRFTSRELAIVAHLLRGYTNRQIANQLQLSERIVKYNMTHIMAKLKARSRLEVAISVRRHEQALKGNPARSACN